MHQPVPTAHCGVACSTVAPERQHSRRQKPPTYSLPVSNTIAIGLLLAALLLAAMRLHALLLALFSDTGGWLHDVGKC